MPLPLLAVGTALAAAVVVETTPPDAVTWTDLVRDRLGTTFGVGECVDDCDAPSGSGSIVRTRDGRLESLGMEPL